MNSFETFTIKPGRGGYSDVNPLRRLWPHFRNRLEFIIRLDESIRYEAENDQQQHSWHKLTGFRESTIEDNSVRLGVRWLHGEVQFAPYIHYRGENLGARDPEVLYSTRNIREEIQGYIVTLPNTYELNVNGHGVEGIPRGGGGLCKFLCWPFFQIRFKPGKEQLIRVKLKIL